MLMSMFRVDMRWSVTEVFKRRRFSGGQPYFSNQPIASPLEFLVGGFGRQPLYDEMGAAARNIHCYTVIGFW